MSRVLYSHPRIQQLPPFRWWMLQSLGVWWNLVVEGRKSKGRKADDKRKSTWRDLLVISKNHKVFKRTLNKSCGHVDFPFVCSASLVLPPFHHLPPAPGSSINDSSNTGGSSNHHRSSSRMEDSRRICILSPLVDGVKGQRQERL